MEEKRSSYYTTKHERERKETFGTSNNCLINLNQRSHYINDHQPSSTQIIVEELN